MNEGARSFDAFVSYASANRERAIAICEQLESRGLRCWIAPRDLRPGNEYGDEIVAGIRDSRCLVLVLSPAANESPMVRREVERAVSLNRAIFPVKVENVSAARSLEFFVATTHAIDAWQGALAGHMDRLAEEIANERMVAELGAAGADKVRRRRARRRLTLSALGLCVVGGLAMALAFSTGGATSMKPDEVKADFAAYGIDVGSINESDFRLQPEVKYGNTPTIRVTSAKQSRDIVAIGVLQGRVGDRPWSTLHTDGEDSRVRVHHLDQRDLRATGDYQLRLISGGADGDARSYGPYTFKSPLAYFDAEKHRGFESLRERAEQAVWLHGSGRWIPAPEFLEFATIVESIDFGDEPDRLGVNYVIPLGSASDPVAQRVQTGRPVDVRNLMSGLSRYLWEHLPNTTTIYARMRYMDGRVGEVRRFPPVDE